MARGMFGNGAIRVLLSSYLDMKCAERNIFCPGPLEQKVSALLGQPVSRTDAFAWLAAEYEKEYPESVKRKDYRYERSIEKLWREVATYKVKEIEASKQKYSRKRIDAKKVNSPAFYRSQAWRKVRYEVLRNSNGCCSLCGKSYFKHGVVLHVDHIKPRSLFPELSLDMDNLQVLCEECNLGKNNYDETSWVKSSPS